MSVRVKVEIEVVDETINLSDFAFVVLYSSNVIRDLCLESILQGVNHLLKVDFGITKDETRARPNFFDLEVENGHLVL